MISLAKKLATLIWLAEEVIKLASTWNPFFSEGVENGLFHGDDILNEYKRKVRRLYNNVTETSTMNIEIETLTMLTTGTFSTGAIRTRCPCWKQLKYDFFSSGNSIDGSNNGWGTVGCNESSSSSGMFSNWCSELGLWLVKAAPIRALIGLCQSII